ncbi:MAG: GNAT family N-acetyltransferase [Acidobacteria bacterium]|nr:GNAT family N-acetyltransferase [Acidobacteriota bacterium]
MPQIAIREAHSAEDIATARRLMREYGEFLSNSPSGAASICLTGYEQELQQLPRGYSVILLAEVDGVPAGCVALREIDRPERACEMKRLWVGSGFRGLRLGRRLIEAALAWAEREGFESMYLDTVPAAMPEANRLYASLGFMPVERYNRNSVVDVEFFYRPVGNVR